MRQSNVKALTILASGLIIFLVTVCIPFDQADAKVKRIIRQSSVSNDYLPGKGTPVGTVRKVYGKVFIIHEDMNGIFKARKGYSLYAGDTLTTKRSGRVRFVLNDESVLTLAPGTTMVLTESMLDPINKKRTGFVNLVTGKARFFVKKFADFRYSTFNVKTKTAIAAVRGTVFIIQVEGDNVTITTEGQSILEIYSPSYPLAAPVVVNSFQQLIVSLGELPGTPFDITEEELRELLKDLGMLDDDDLNMLLDNQSVSPFAP